MSYCGEASLVNRRETTVRVVSLRCRSWTCDECSVKRRADLIDIAQSGRPERFITLTMAGREPGSEARNAAALARCWRLIVKRFERTFKKHIEYLAVFEAHPSSGFPHLHILQRGAYMSQRWLSRTMASLADSPIVDIRAVKGKAQIARYVTKYIGKAPGKFGTCKRYWQSKHYATWKRWYPRNLDDYRAGWSRHQRTALEMVVLLHWQGFRFAKDGRAGWLGVFERREPPG